MNDKGKQADLATENRHLRHILDNVGAYVFTKDREGRYTFANVMVCELFGRTLEEVVGKTDESFFDLSISNELRENDLDVLQRGERVECEERNIVATTGEELIFWTVKIPLCDAGGSVQGLCGISTDITERRRLERQLAEQKNLLDVVLENMDAYVYMKDRQRRYKYVNGKTANLYGLRPEEIVGRSDDELLPREMADKFAVLDNQVINGGIKRAGEEIVQGLDGEKRHYWSNKIPLFKDGELDSFIGVSTDISEVVRLKNEFRDLARIDVLTGVLTRRFLLEYVELE
ncbi:MAG: PAS domain-containing protein, partial [Haliea sp.]